MSDNSAEKLEALHRRLKALVFGGVDMCDVLQTALYLRGDHSEAPGHDGGMPWRARRTLEAGMFVVYARSFTRTRRDGLPRLDRAAGLTGDLCKSHEEILSRRDRVYAHTDDTPYRQILELAGPDQRAQWIREQGDLSEQWSPPTREMLDDVIALAAAHLTSFYGEIDEIRTAILVELLIDGSEQSETRLGVS